MPADGRLFLGVNDDEVNDNHGEFTVDVRPDTSTNRRYVSTSRGLRAEPSASGSRILARYGLCCPPLLLSHDSASCDPTLWAAGTRRTPGESA